MSYLQELPTIALAGASGALVLSLMLTTSGGSFRPFLIFSGLAALLGGGVLLMLGRPLPVAISTSFAPRTCGVENKTAL